MKLSGDQMVNNNESNLQETWTKVQSRLRAELGEDVFSSWFGRVELEQYESGCVQFSVPTRFLKSWLKSHYSDRVVKAFSTELKDVEGVDFRVGD